MNHKGTAVLETERLILRQFTPEDACAVYNNWANDPEVTRFLNFQPHADVTVSQTVISEWVEDYKKVYTYRWAIVPKDFKEPIGYICVGRSTHDAGGIVHIDYCIGKNWWRQGYTSEAAKELVRFFFEEVGANRVESHHDPRNPNSGKVMVKAGLKFEGILRQSDWNNQGICDAAYYALTADEYFGSKDKSSGPPAQTPQP